MMYVDPRKELRHAELVDVLEVVCETLELSDSDYEVAKKRYEGVGEWLAGSDDPLLASIAIGLQGSVAIRTTVKPIGANEHDVDLVAHVSNLDMAVSPSALKGSIGRRLRGNGNYAPLLEEMPRCWRLNYANEFHMDITPSIPNPLCRFDGELVPDKTLKEWKASNPKGYRVLFEKRASLLPNLFLSAGDRHDLPTPQVLFATHQSKHSNRPVETVTPLATALHLSIDSTILNEDYATLASTLVGGKYAGKVVLVSWHHGNIPQLATALGAQPPYTPWPDTQFDRIWRIDYKDGKATLKDVPQHLLPGDSE